MDKTDENRNETIDVDSNTNFEDKENADANDEIISIDPADVEWSFVERIEDDDLINILFVGQYRRK